MDSDQTPKTIKREDSITEEQRKRLDLFYESLKTNDATSFEFSDIWASAQDIKNEENIDNKEDKE